MHNPTPLDLCGRRTHLIIPLACCVKGLGCAAASKREKKTAVESLPYRFSTGSDHPSASGAGGSQVRMSLFHAPVKVHLYQSVLLLSRFMAGFASRLLRWILSNKVKRLWYCASYSVPDVVA
jgi:hypothetical protein